MAMGPGLFVLNYSILGCASLTKTEGESTSNLIDARRKKLPPNIET